MCRVIPAPMAYVAANLVTLVINVNSKLWSVIVPLAKMEELVLSKSTATSVYVMMVSVSRIKDDF